MTKDGGRRVPSVPGCSLVAYWGAKEKPLAALIAAVQTLATEVLGDAVAPRSSTQIHATLLGLPAPAGGYEDRRRALGYLDHVGHTLDDRRLTVQFGGWQPAGTYGLLSRGRTLYDRSVGVHGDKIVMVGWPVSNGAAVPDLDDLRRAAQAFGLRHKYHEAPGDVDPDAYMVIADVIGAPAAGTIDEFEDAARAELARSTVRTSLTAADVSVVRYVSTKLPADSSTATSLTSLRQADPGTTVC